MRYIFQIAILAVIAAGLGVGGYRAWGYFSLPTHSCLLPPSQGTGTHMTVGSADSPVSHVSGRVARLERAENPIQYTLLKIDAEARAVYFDGDMYRRTVVPQSGSIRAIGLNGKTMKIADGRIARGCINIEKLGPTIVLFEHGQVPTLTVVLNEKQLERIR